MTDAPDAGGRLAHALGIRRRELGKPRAETVVETVAYIGCAEAELDVSAAAVPYVAGWAADDPDLIEGDVALIDELFKWFASRLAQTDEEVERLPAAA